MLKKKSNVRKGAWTRIRGIKLKVKIPELLLKEFKNKKKYLFSDYDNLGAWG